MRQPGIAILCCAAAGMIVALTMVMARERAAEPSATVRPQEANPPAAPIPPQCRTVAQPDASCLAIWEERRRRFFASDRPR